MENRYVLPAMLAAAILPFAATAKPVNEDLTQVFVANGEMHYVGTLTEAANAKLFTLYKGATKKPDTLSIHSPGGNTDVGMELGKWVHQNKLDVKVLEGCYSSCANYVFPAARRKIVSNFAVIGYHGGLTSMSFSIDDASIANLAATFQKDGQEVTRENVMELLRKINAPAIERETKYFDMIGVQQRITTLGQEAKHKSAAPEDAVGWYYSEEDFAKLGVSGIKVINPPWRPEANPSGHTVFKVGVE